jgi:hypothetical protein
MKRGYWILSLVLLCCPTPARCGDCSPEEARAAEQEAAYLRNWDAIYGSYERFKECDDGSVAEGYSESVVTTLRTRWDDIRRLQQLGDEHEGFRPFVLRHIDETVSVDALKEIERNARLAVSQGLQASAGRLKSE